MIFLFGFEGGRTCSTGLNKALFLLAWDQALHWGEKEKKSRRGRKKASEASREVV